MVQLSYLGLWSSIETVFSHLLQQLGKVHGLKNNWKESTAFALNICKWSAFNYNIILDKDEKP